MLRLDVDEQLTCDLSDLEKDIDQFVTEINQAVNRSMLKMGDGEQTRQMLKAATLSDVTEKKKKRLFGETQPKPGKHMK